MFGNLLKSKSMSFTNKGEVNIMGVSPAVARFVWNEDIRAAYQKAKEAFSHAYEPVADMEQKSIGYGIVSPAQRAQNMMTNEQQQKTNKDFEEMDKHIENALRDIEKRHKEYLKATRLIHFLMISLATLLFLVGIFAICYGVIKGSKVSLVGGGGVVTAALGFAYKMFNDYLTREFVIRDMVSLLRLRFRVCTAHEGYAEKIVCLKKTLEKATDYFNILQSLSQSPK